MAFLAGAGGGGGIGSGLIRIGAVTSGLRGQVRGAVRDIKSELNTGARSIEQQGQRWNRAFGMIGAAAKLGAIGAGVAIAGAVASAIGFESAFAGVIKTVDAAPAVLERLRMRFRAMATEIPISANQFAALGEAAGALGVKVDDIEEFTRVTALIGVTTNVAAEQAATSLGQLGNVLDLRSKDYSRFASVLVDLGNKGASTESQILEIAARAGAVGHNIGLSNPAILAFSSAIANLGIEVEAGGTALQFLFTRMGLLLAKKDKLKELGKVAGMTGADFKKAFLTDAQGAIVAFLRGLAKLDPVQQAVALDELGLAGARTTRAYTGLAASLDKNLIPAFANADKAWKDNTALQAEADKRFRTTASQLQLLKNRIIELFLSLGDRLLPGFNAVLTWINEKLPSAFAYLAQVWSTILAPAIGGFLGSMGKLIGAFGDVIGVLTGFGNKAGGQGGPATVFEGIASAAATVFNWLGKVADVITALLSNPVIKGLAALTTGFLAFAAAVGLGRAAVGRLQGASGSLLRTLTGGRLGGSAAAATDPGTAALKGAAAQHEVAAKELQGAAASLKGAASAQVTRSDLGMVGLRNTPNRGGPINYGGIPGPAVSLNGELAKRERAAFAALSKEQQAIVARAAQPMARAMGEAAKTGMLTGLRGSLVGAGGFVKGKVKGIAGGAAKLFWPLVIADLGLEIIKAPVGDFVMNNTKFKRAGQSLKEDFITGLGNLVSAWNLGSDLFVDLPELKLGKFKFKTASLGAFDLTPEQIEALQSGGLGGALAENDIAPEALRQLQRLAGEKIGDWYERVIDRLKQYGVNTKAIEANFSTLRGFWDETDATRLNNELESMLTSAVGRLSRDVLDSTSKGLSQGVVDAVRAATGGRVTLSKLTTLSPEAYKAIAELLVNGASGALDPKVLALTLSGLLDDPKYKPKSPKVAPTSKADKAQSDRESMHAITAAIGSGPEATIRFKVDTSRRAIRDAQQSLADWIKNLTPEQASAREYGLKALDMINAGIKDAGKNKSRQKAFLADINRALGLTGEDKMSWEDLIDWQKQLSEDTGVTAQKEINKRLRNWSVQGARYGAEGGAAEFWKWWGPSIEKADTAAEKEALRKKINDLIPGTADDFSKKQFAAFLKDMQAKAQDDTAETANQSFLGWVGNLINNPADAITELSSGFGAAVMGALGQMLGDPDLLTKLGENGKKILTAIASLWNAPETQEYLKRKFHQAIRGVTASVPSSPVKEGPLKHPFLPKAGANIIRQIADGMASASLTVPPLAMDEALAGMPRGGRGGVTLHANHLNVLGPADAQSLTERLAFLGNR